MSIQEFTPVDELFTFDYKQNAWVKQADFWQDKRKLKAKNVTLIFYNSGKSFGLDYEDHIYIMWCDKHQAYERYQENGITENGCRPNYFQFYADDIHPRHPSVLGKSLPIFWHVKQSKIDEALEVTVQTLKIKLLKAIKESDNDIIYAPTIELGKVFSYTFFPATKTYKAIPASVNRRWGVDFCVPWPVVYKVQSCLRNTMSRLTGRNVLLPENETIRQWTDLWHVIEHPEDVHICYLQDFFGYAYEVLFFKGKNHYELTCKVLNIKPPKSIRRYYLQNPYAILLYTWLTRIGFKDINAIRIFMNSMYYHCMDSVRLNIKTGKMHNCSLPCASSGMDFVFYVRWMLLRGKEEMPLARQLDKLMREGWTRLYDDMLHMFHLYYLVLPEQTKELVKRRGICLDTHNALAYDTTFVNVVAKTIQYNDEVYALNFKIGDVNFRVIDNMAELAGVGRAMSNCVASYMDRVLQLDVIIAVGMIGEEYKICIELRPKTKNKQGQPVTFACYQALGRFNYDLYGNEKTAYKIWIKEKNIEDFT